MADKPTRKQSIVGLGVISLLAGTASGAPDTTGWLCQRCPFETSSRGATEARSGYVSDEQLRYGHFSGHDDQGAYLAVSGRLTNTDSNRHLELRLQGPRSHE